MLRISIRQEACLSVNGDASKSTDGAYRDGLYHGELAAQRGSAVHVTSGRWAADQDRTSFAAGYEQGYNKFFNANLNTAQATNAAFRDGLFLGGLAARHGDESQIAVGRWATSQDPLSFTMGYQQGYAKSGSVHAASISSLHRRQ
jgi:hypothetical protein